VIKLQFLYSCKAQNFLVVLLLGVFTFPSNFKAGGQPIFGCHIMIILVFTKSCSAFYFVWICNYGTLDITNIAPFLPLRRIHSLVGCHWLTWPYSCPWLDICTSKQHRLVFRGQRSFGWMPTTK